MKRRTDEKQNIWKLRYDQEISKEKGNIANLNVKERKTRE